MLEILKLLESFDIDEKTKNKVGAACVAIYVNGIEVGVKSEREKWQQTKEAAERVAADLQKFQGQLLRHQDQLLMYMPSKGRA